MSKVALAEFPADIMQQAEDIGFFRTKAGIKCDLFSAVGSRAAVITPWARIAQLRLGQNFFCLFGRGISSFAGICNPDKVVIFILPDNASAVVKHNLEGSRVVQIDPQIDFFLRNNTFCGLNGELQARRPISFSPFFFPDAVSDMTGAFPEGFRQIVPYSEFSDQAAFIPQIVLCFRDKPIRHIYRVLIGDQCRQHFFFILIERNAMIRVRQPILIRRQYCCIFPLSGSVLHIDFPQFHCLSFKAVDSIFEQFIGK